MGVLAVLYGNSMYEYACSGFYVGLSNFLSDMSPTSNLVCVDIFCTNVTGRVHPAKLLPNMEFHTKHTRLDIRNSHIVLKSGQAILFACSSLSVLSAKHGSNKGHF